MPQSSSEEKRRHWAENILQQQKSGQNIHRWCRENNISYTAFFYWKERLGNSSHKPISRSDFTELSSASSNDPGLTLEYQGIRIVLSKDFDVAVLGKCLRVLRSISC